jgi:hypothetical protein
LPEPSRALKLFATRPDLSKLIGYTWQILIVENRVSAQTIAASSLIVGSV